MASTRMEECTRIFMAHKMKKILTSFDFILIEKIKVRHHSKKFDDMVQFRKINYVRSYLCNFYFNQMTIE